MHFIWLKIKLALVYRL